MNKILKIVIGVASIIIILAGIKAASDIIGFILIAVLLAISITPIVIYLTKKGLKRKAALSIVIISLLIIGSVLIQQLGSSIYELSRTLPSYELRMQEIIISTDNFLERYNLDVDKIIEQFEIDTKVIFQFAASLLSRMGNYIGSGIFLLIILSLMVIEFSGYESSFKAGNIKRASFSAKLYDIRTEVRKYLSITALTGFIAAVCNLILLLVLGVDFPFLWAALSFFLNFIPVLGVLIYTLLPCLMALLQFGWTEALIVAIGFTIFNIVADNIIKPKLLKDGLKISLLMIFLSLYFWNWVLGFSGAILAIPLTIVFKRIISELSKDKNILDI